MSDTKDWELTEDEFAALPENQKAMYRQAVEFKTHEQAYGPWGGWARGNDILKSMGWKEKEGSTGHRTFVSLTKPMIHVSENKDWKPAIGSPAWFFTLKTDLSGKTTSA